MIGTNVYETKYCAYVDILGFLLEPNEFTRPLARKRVTVLDYPDGRLAGSFNIDRLKPLDQILGRAEAAVAEIVDVPHVHERLFALFQRASWDKDGHRNCWEISVVL
jgi:hypothetical protein